MNSTDIHARSTVAFVGGGSVGHVAPAIAVWEALKKRCPEIEPLFLCSSRQDEAEILRAYDVPFTVIHAGKFPRGFTVRWLTFPVLFLVSLIESFRQLRSHHVTAIFSKGGYLSVPVCLAGTMLGIPIILHESDSVTGLGNHLISRLASTVCRGFPPSPDDARTIVTGNPLRPDILQGSIDAGRRITGFSGRKPVIMIIGGSQGAQSINDAVDDQLDDLLKLGDVIHLTGRGKMTNRRHARYVARAFVIAELPHMYALATIVVSRAGAGSLSELAALGKPVIVIPLAGVAHDHQVMNAQVLAKAGAVIHLPQEEMQSLPTVIGDLLEYPERRRALGDNLHTFFPPNAADRIAEIIEKKIRNK